MEFAYFDNNKYKINIHNRNTMPKKIQYLLHVMLKLIINKYYFLDFLKGQLGFHEKEF